MTMNEERFILRPIETYVSELHSQLGGDLPSCSELLDIEPPDDLYTGNDELHQKDHAARTLLWVKIFTKLLSKNGANISATEGRAVNYAALLHDIGRNGAVDDELHGERSAEMAGHYLARSEDEECIFLTQELIKGHVPRVSVDMRVQPNLLTALKEADRIDLPRTGQPLDHGRIFFTNTTRLYLPIAQSIRFDSITNIQSGIPRYQSVIEASAANNVLSRASIIQ